MKIQIEYWSNQFILQKPENTTDIKIGTLIAVMVEEGDDWRKAEIPVESGSQTEPITTLEKSPSTEEHTTTTKTSQ